MFTPKNWYYQKSPKHIGRQQKGNISPRLPNFVKSKKIYQKKFFHPKKNYSQKKFSEIQKIFQLKKIESKNFKNILSGPSQKKSCEKNGAIFCLSKKNFTLTFQKFFQFSSSNSFPAS